MAQSLKDMKKQNDLSIRLKLVILAVSVIAAFVVFIILYATKVEKALPIGFTVFFALFGATYVGFSAYVKDILGYIAGAVALVAGVIVLLALAIEVNWVIWLVSALVLATILVVLLFIAIMPKLQVAMDNDDSGYKDFKQRKEEKEAMPKEQEEPLPELKSFKDDN